MKVVLPGGSGAVGQVLIRHFSERGDECVVLSRRAGQTSRVRSVEWDGRTLGSWVSELEGADVVINLAGRTVNCRYNEHNLRQMMDSRADSTRVVGQAISQAQRPPRVWLQSSTATIYAHRFDAANDEELGILGGSEEGAPPKWVASIEIANAWEAALNEAETPHTRKVAMRSAMTMSPDKGSIFDVLRGLAKWGLFGTMGSGRQFVSWIHELDFARAVQFLVDSEIEGAVNLCSPFPLPQSEFAAVLRRAVGGSFGIPAAEWLVEVGCLLRGTESELVLKSRRVEPKRLLDAGFEFRFPQWEDAARDLAGRR